MMIPTTFKTRRGRLDLTRFRTVWKRFNHYTRQYRWGLLGAFAAAVAAVVTQLAAPWPIKVIFDVILVPSPQQSWMTNLLARFSAGPMEALAWVCAAILLIAVLEAAFSHIRDVVLAQTGQRVIGKVRQDLFRHLQTLPPSEFERRRTGDLLMRLTGDVQMLREMLVSALVQVGQSVLVIVAMIAAMFWLNPLLAALGLTVMPVVLFAMYRTTRQIRKATERQRERESEVASVAHDVLGAMAVIQAFNREKTERDRFARQNRSAVRAGVRTTRLESRLYRTLSVASAAALCLILYVGVRSVLSGVMTAGDLLVFVAYLRALQKPVRNLSKLSGQMAKATTCGLRVSELFAIQPAVSDPPDARPLKRIRGEITFDQVEFQYENGVQALHGVSLTIRPGERVAIVGHTGAGKSTLAKLLLRFYVPQSGRVLFDGQDTRLATAESIRRQIGWVHQDTLLFGMTVEENIAFGRPDATPEQIRAVAARVHADEFIDTLPNGYQTVLGQNGSMLSGGQRQRIALARALLRGASILILDEPAVGLDDKTRVLVEQSWMSEANRATTLVICHRLHDMQRFNRIVVFDHGVVREIGTHRELLAAGGEYAALYRAGLSLPPPAADDGMSVQEQDLRACSTATCEEESAC